MEYTKEQIKAASALNLCTVSVSQIIEYNDLNIMEQEYEAILNNINIEEMPKDEALLKIIKQILDTITFFRMQEGDKQMIDKEYQQKTKNAIWSAVPNIGLLVAGGSPVTMAISLASQIGIGYMNYRKTKAENEWDKEKQEWQLQRAAIEQFNGLRRELFDTAWRLSSAYEFPDQLRLTERQIKRYDAILLDNDLIRKYNRLSVIKDEFLAYPPFWYHYGNTANAIANSELSISETTREKYKSLAANHFRQFRESNQNALLREDPIAAACALEYADMLDCSKDAALIEELLSEAINFSGRREDVLQLSAVTYLKLNKQDKAAELLSQLVDEEYNTALNAQLLSGIYVHNIIEGSSADRIKYEMLKNQVGESYLYLLPEDGEQSLEALEADFITAQKEILLRKYSIAINSFIKKYIIRFGKIIPVADPTKDYEDSYFLCDNNSIEERSLQIRKLFDRECTREEYCRRLSEAQIPYAIVELLNDLFNSCCMLDFMTEEVQDALAKCIRNGIADNKDELNSLIKKLENNKFDVFDMEKLLHITFTSFAGEFVEKLKSTISSFVDSRLEMQDLSIAEQDLGEFCKSESIVNPNECYGKDGLDSVSRERIVVNRFAADMIDGYYKQENEEDHSFEKMRKIIESQKENIISSTECAELYISGDSRVERYFSINSKLNYKNNIKAGTLAILDDKTEKGDFDLIFTLCGLVPVKNGAVKNTVPYSEVYWATGKYNGLVIGNKYDPATVKCNELYELIKELAKYEKPMPESETIFRLPSVFR